MNRLRIVLVAVVALSASGCASIIKGGGSQSVSIRSMPSEADVKIVDVKTGNTISTGKTPFIVPLNKSRGYFAGSQYRVTVEKSGFERREAVIDSNANGWYIAGNLVFGGLIGWLIVDPATGAMWNLDPEELSVELNPVQTPSDAQPAAKPVALAPVMTMDELAAAHPELVSKLVRIETAR